MKALLSSVFFCTAVLSATLVGASQATAMTGDDSHGWIGATGGLSVPNADHTTARGIYGITGGAKIGSNLGLGLYYLTSSKSETNVGDFNYDFYGVDFGYYFDGEANGVYFGGRLGMSKLNVGSGTAQISTSPMHYGVFAGYNYMLTDHFSLGGEASFMSVPESSGTPTGSTVSETISSFTILNFMANAKLWF